MCDHNRRFDTGHDLDLCAASFIGFDIDTEHTFQSLHPRHGPMPLFRRLFQPVAGCSFSLPPSLSSLAQGDLNSMFTVRGEYTVATGSVDPGFRRLDCQDSKSLVYLKKLHETEYAHLYHSLTLF